MATVQHGCGVAWCGVASTSVANESAITEVREGLSGLLPGRVEVIGHLEVVGPYVCDSGGKGEGEQRTAHGTNAKLITRDWMTRGNDAPCPSVLYAQSNRRVGRFCTQG